MESIAGGQGDNEGAPASFDDQSISLVERLTVSLTQQEVD